MKYDTRRTVPLSQVCTLNMGQSPSSDSYNENKDGLPFFQGNADFGNIYPKERVWCSQPTKIANKDDILLSVRAPIGALNIAKEECCIGRGLAALSPIPSQCRMMYLFYALKSKVKILEQQGTGSTFKAVGKDIISALHIPLYPLEEQEHIISMLSCTDIGIANIHKQLAKLDTLVKSRFIEMFGDPVTNPMGISTKPMTDICQIVDGDRGKNYPKAEDLQLNGACLFLNAKNVTATGFRFDECMFITKDKDEAMRKGKLQRGDIILTTRGTIGNLAIYTDNVPYDNVRINSGMVILRLNEKEINDAFFVKQFRMQLKNIIQKIVSGSAQPQLPISTMNRIEILSPPIALQNQFAAFVQQVDKSKSVLQKFLEKQELLRAALMQEYFG